MAAVAAGVALLGASLAVADVTYGNVQLVNQNGQPVAQVVVGSNAAASDGVVAANIAAMIGNMAYKTQTISASTTGTATCSLGGGSTSGGTCAISNEKVKLQVTLPGVVAGAYGWKTLINDYTDKKTENRNGSGLDDLYNTTFSEISGFDVPLKGQTWSGFETTNNKITYQTGDGIPSVYARQAVKKIGGSDFSSFATFNTKDNYAGFSYTEDQQVWVYTETISDTTLKKVVAKKPFIAYRAQFSKGGDTYGIPFCTTKASNASGWWGLCNSNDDRSDRHRVAIKWLGQDWIISEMNLPDNTNVTAGGANDITVNTAYNFSAGGSVKLAKESSYGIVHIGENLTAGNYVVKLVDITVPSTNVPYGAAAIEIYDANGQKVKEDRIAAVTGSDLMTWTAPDGTKIKIKVYKATPGYTLTAKWAEMAIYAQEIELKDDEKLNDDNTYWKAKVLWKNKDYDSSNPNPNVDALWGLELQNAADVDVYSTLKMDKGATLNIPKTDAILQLQYDGLTLTDADYDLLTFSPVTTVFTNFAEGTSGTCTSGVSSGQQLILVTSGMANAFTISGITTNQFWVDLMNATSSPAFNNSNMSIYYNGGDCVHRLQPTSVTTASVQYNAGDGNQPINFITIAPGAATDNQTVNINVREDPGNTPATNGYDFWNLTMKINTSSANTWTFTSDTKVNYTEVTYGTRQGSMKEVEEGYVSARGSVFSSVDSGSGGSLVLKAAKKVAEAQYYLKTVGSTPNAPVEVTLGEGESATLSGGVVIKVASITEDVGACTASAGSSTCTVDQSGVSAVLSTGGASVTASVPYTLATNSQPLVVLDKDASTGTVISVGGPDVNTVTKNILAGSDTSITASSAPTVKVVGDNKIVVAGGQAADTVRAGNDFIAGLKKA
ncbi:MAG: S-layer protein [Candidatus Micrarchaeia archaeon]